MATRDALRPTTTISATLSLPSSAAAAVPDSGDDQQTPAPETSENPDPYDPNSTREPKRRRKCLRALDKVEELLIASPNFSFTFDTKPVASAPEITPKFGSFNLAVSSSSVKRKTRTEEERAELGKRQGNDNIERSEIDCSIEEETNKED